MSVRRSQIGCRSGGRAILANQTLGGITNSGDRLLFARGRPTMNEVSHIAINCNSSSLAKATRAMKASSRWKLGGLELAAPYLWPGFLSEVDKAATRAEALVPRHSYMARVGRRTGNKSAARCFARSVSANLIMLISYGVVGSTAVYDFTYGTGINL